MNRVLIVDDDRQLLRALRINLTARHYDVATAADGATALATAARTPPDLAIVDLGLPDLDGVAVIQGLRGWTTIPVIVLSARDAARGSGVPLDPDDMLRSFETRMEAQTQRALQLSAELEAAGVTARSDGGALSDVLLRTRWDMADDNQRAAERGRRMDELLARAETDVNRTRAAKSKPEDAGPVVEPGEESSSAACSACCSYSRWRWSWARRRQPSAGSPVPISTRLAGAAPPQ